VACVKYQINPLHSPHSTQYFTHQSNSKKSPHLVRANGSLVPGPEKVLVDPPQGGRLVFQQTKTQIVPYRKHRKMQENICGNKRG